MYSKMPTEKYFDGLGGQLPVVKVKQNLFITGRRKHPVTSFFEIGLPDSEKKIFEGFLPYMGMTAILVMRTR